MHWNILILVWRTVLITNYLAVSCSTRTPGTTTELIDSVSTLFLPNVSSSTPDTPTPLLQLLLLLEVIVIIKETKQPVIQTVSLTGLEGTNLLMQKGKKVGPILCRWATLWFFLTVIGAYVMKVIEEKHVQ